MDALFIKRFGRRKTWLVPVQYSIGITMLLLAQNVDYYLDQKPNPDVFRYVLNYDGVKQFLNDYYYTPAFSRDIHDQMSDELQISI